MKLPAGANADSNKHNEEGIDHWNQGHFDVALKHFAMASKIDSGPLQKRILMRPFVSTN